MMRGATKALDAEFSNRASRIETTRTQIQVLRALMRNGATMQRAIIPASEMDRSTLSEMLKRLLFQKLVASVRLQRDMRVTVISITPAGVAALKHAEKILAASEAAMLRKIPPAQRAIFLQNLARIGAA